MIETRRLKNVVIFVQTILSFVLSRKIIVKYFGRKSSVTLFLLALELSINLTEVTPFYFKLKFYVGKLLELR